MVEFIKKYFHESMHVFELASVVKRDFPECEFENATCLVKVVKKVFPKIRARACMFSMFGL